MLCLLNLVLDPQSPQAQLNPATKITLAIAALSLSVSILSLVLTLRQKEDERRSSIFHAQVVTPALKAVDCFVEIYREKLLAVLVDVPADSARLTHDRKSTQLHTAMSAALYELKDSLVLAVEVFDIKAANSIAQTIRHFDDSITAWMFATQPRDRETLRPLLAGLKRQVLICIYKADRKLIR